MQATKIAFDLGGVILHRQALQNFIVEQSDISVKLSIQKFGAANVFIISKAKQKYIQRNIDLLRNNNFLQKTGLMQQNIYFVDQYEDKSKLMKKLGISYILDDYVKVAKDCMANGLKPVLFGDHQQFIKQNPQFVNVKTWKSFRKYLQKIPR